jgi:hypothetical protein
MGFSLALVVEQDIKCSGAFSFVLPAPATSVTVYVDRIAVDHVRAGY